MWCTINTHVRIRLLTHTQAHTAQSHIYLVTMPGPESYWISPTHQTLQRSTVNLFICFSHHVLYHKGRNFVFPSFILCVTVGLCLLSDCNYSVFLFVFYQLYCWKALHWPFVCTFRNSTWHVLHQHTALTFAVSVKLKTSCRKLFIQCKEMRYYNSGHMLVKCSWQFVVMWGIENHVLD